MNIGVRNQSNWLEEILAPAWLRCISAALLFVVLIITATMDSALAQNCDAEMQVLPHESLTYPDRPIIKSRTLVGSHSPQQRAEPVHQQISALDDSLLTREIKIDEISIVGEYELYAVVGHPTNQAPVLSVLHGSNQHVFNKDDARILSPQFCGQPPPPIIASKERWFTPPVKT